jgi:hypothetical protein
MGILERLHRMDMEAETTNGSTPQSSSPAEEDRHPVSIRFDGVMKEFLSYTTRNGTARSRQIGLVLEAVMEEIGDEMNDLLSGSSSDDDSQTMIAGYFAWVGEILAWVGSGDTDSLPPEMQAIARRIMGESEQKELTAG